MYKKRGEASDKFHNLFQTFKNLYSHDSAGIELLDFFRYDFVAQAQDVSTACSTADIDMSNLHCFFNRYSIWMHEIFVGSRKYLLVH